MVKTRLFEPRTDPYVLPSQSEQVFYSAVPGKESQSFIARHDPRERPIKYNLDDANEEGSLEEGYDDEEHDQHELGDDNDLAEYVQEIVESDDVADNAHEYYIGDDMMSITELDDDDDMANPYSVEFGSNDTYDDLDEEDDGVDEEDDENIER